MSRLLHDYAVLPCNEVGSYNAPHYREQCIELRGLSERVAVRRQGRDADCLLFDGDVRQCRGGHAVGLVRSMRHCALEFWFGRGSHGWEVIDLSFE